MAAELGPHDPLIQVLMPNRGSTHTCRTIQLTRTPKGMRSSVALSPLSRFLMFIEFLYIHFITHETIKTQDPKHFSLQAISFRALHRRRGQSTMRPTNADPIIWSPNDGWSACSLTKPMVGFEPTTPALRKRCSTVELHRRPTTFGL